jgi:pyrimidine deaminase RibD-like protein
MEAGMPLNVFLKYHDDMLFNRITIFVTLTPPQKHGSNRPCSTKNQPNNMIHTTGQPVG